MHKVTFFPLGNADSYRINLENGKRILFDYADVRDPDDKDDLRCDLPKLLRDDLVGAKRDYFDVVAFTHLDKDHYSGATDFFWLEHDAAYQDDDRIRIETMWVPAAAITEDKETLVDDEARVLQKEARHRFREKKGIRVFSRPQRLREWCEQDGIDLDDRLHLVTDAGEVAPEFTLPRDGVEFFVHSPFAKRLNDNEVEDRNSDAIAMHATFRVDETDTKFLLLSDLTYEDLAEIVRITNEKGNGVRLEWDFGKLPHHCSYKSIGPEKGTDKTEPDPDVAELYEDRQNKPGILVSTSKPIPKKGSEEDEDNNPPHRQAANYYKDALDDDGDFYVTMEHPKPSAPEALVVKIDAFKATVEKATAAGVAAIVTSSPPRAG